MDLTQDQLSAATGCSDDKAEAWLAPITQACEVFGINTPLRVSAFLAQIGHETGGLVWIREIWGPTPAQQRYEGRADLGNVQPGDGRRYQGRGLIQTTGRANYCATRDGLAQYLPHVPDFEAVPALLERPDMAAMSAAWYWHSHGLNDLADEGTDDAFVHITRKINGGTNGLADRQALYVAAQEAIA